MASSGANVLTYTCGKRIRKSESGNASHNIIYPQQSVLHTQLTHSTASAYFSLVPVKYSCDHGHTGGASSNALSTAKLVNGTILYLHWNSKLLKSVKGNNGMVLP